ncbi:hypothetical protein A2U01_0032363, partial [Trifolium medium]|nr:hypothetical protein [Trifolium medium]
TSLRDQRIKGRDPTNGPALETNPRAHKKRSEEETKNHTSWKMAKKATSTTVPKKFKTNGSDPNQKNRGLPSHLEKWRQNLKETCARQSESQINQKHVVKSPKVPLQRNIFPTINLKTETTVPSTRVTHIETHLSKTPPTPILWKKPLETITGNLRRAKKR